MNKTRARISLGLIMVGNAGTAGQLAAMLGDLLFIFPILFALFMLEGLALLRSYVIDLKEGTEPEHVADDYLFHDKEE